MNCFVKIGIASEFGDENFHFLSSHFGFFLRFYWTLLDHFNSSNEIYRKFSIGNSFFLWKIHSKVEFNRQIGAPDCPASVILTYKMVRNLAITLLEQRFLSKMIRLHFLKLNLTQISVTKKLLYLTQWDKNKLCLENVVKFWVFTHYICYIISNNLFVHVLKNCHLRSNDYSIFQMKN